MELSNLKNMNVTDLVSKLKETDLFSDKKALIKFGIGFVAILFSLIGYHFWVSPVIKTQESEIEMNVNKLQEIDDFKINITDFTQQIKEIEPDYQKNSKLFHSKREVEDLYESINNYALANGLSIINIKKGEPKGVSGQLEGIDSNQDMGTMDSENINMDETMNDESGNIEGADLTGMEEEGGSILYYKIPVDYEIMGTFLGYLKFRKALSQSMKVINFDKEEISLLKEQQGQVLSKGTISIVGLPNEYK